MHRSRAVAEALPVFAALSVVSSTSDGTAPAVIMFPSGETPLARWSPGSF